MTSHPSFVISLAVSAVWLYLYICYKVTAPGNMLDLQLTSPSHSRSKQMSPNERPYNFLSIINNKFSRICKGYQVTALCQGHSKSKTMAPNETSYMGHFHKNVPVTVKTILKKNSFVFCKNQVNPPPFNDI